MSALFKLPSPCEVGAEHFTPTATGEYCDKCQKNVVDYSNMTDKEVQQHVKENGFGCGIFNSHQIIISDTGTKKHYTLWYGFLSLLFLFFIGNFNKGYGQSEKIGDTIEIDKSLYAIVIGVHYLDSTKEEYDLYLRYLKDGKKDTLPVRLRGTGSFCLRTPIPNPFMWIMYWLKIIKMPQEKPEVKMPAKKEETSQFF